MNAGKRERVHLLLSAGGVRCLSYIGALEQLEQEGFEIATVSTCSAGTLVGALYSAGVAPGAMREAALELNLRRFAGDARCNWLRRLGTLRSWPALYPRPGIPHVFADILEKHGLDPDPTLGELRPSLSTAAFDVAAGRLLVYSTKGNRDMRVTELLGIATAIPIVYPPHERRGRQLLDASVASYAPIWLASGQDEDLPIVVLRTHRRKEKQGPTGAPGATGLPGWINEIMSGVKGVKTPFRHSHGFGSARGFMSSRWVRDAVGRASVFRPQAPARLHLTGYFLFRLHLTGYVPFWFHARANTKNL